MSVRGSAFGFILALFLFGGGHVFAARTHTVQRGENLTEIADRYGVSVGELVRLNNLRDKNQIVRGQKLVLPDDPGAAWTGAHVVRSGETISSIAAAHGVSVAALTQANGLRDADMVKQGQTLRVPGAPPGAPAPAPVSTTATHIVGRGDTLSSIALQHGVTVAALSKANNLRDADLVKRGQKLIIPGSTVAAAPPPQTQPAAADQSRTHTIRRGETLSSIASDYGVTMRDLAGANRLKDADLLFEGQKLTIPQGATAFIEHRVAKGESLSVIADRYKVALADIKASNTLKDPRLIRPGQILRIPASDTAVTESQAVVPRAAPIADPRRRLPAAIQAAIASARVKSGRWKHIVIHHSATDVGTGRGMDRYHREERNMENGLAYHFVIGNGNGMREGAVFVGRRWNEQLDGGHLAIQSLNQNSLGICLVGDFEKRAPSRRQLDVLEALVRALQKRTGISDDKVTTHQLIHPKHTKCPGRYFPTEEFAQRIRQP